MHHVATLAGDRTVKLLQKTIVALLFAATHSLVGQAQDTLVSPPRSGERLSDWILRQPNYHQTYLLGLRWETPAKTDQQAKLKNHLLAQLFSGRDISAPQFAREHISAWIKSLPVTGRIPVRMTDPRWLQGHPDEDPVLDSDQRLTLPARPQSVTVVLGDGARCNVKHTSGAEALYYISLCRPASAELVDRIWLVQPEGIVQAVNVAAWNQEAQDEPAPGAILWAPERTAGWSRQFSALFAEFLATQGDIPVDRQNIMIGDQPRPTERARDPMITANDWGLTGLLQTPTARMAETGELRIHFSHVYPYTRGTTLFQPLDWLEAGFRYTDISNRLYGPVELSGSQSYKDKSLDFKLRLLKESAMSPAIALGITDIGGTGFFSSEYIVASKRTGDFDWSLGLGWGYLAGSNNIGNPFAPFGASFKTRSTETGSGGTVGTKGMFHGRAALFGGVQYHTPWDNLLVKLEYDGNNYQHEPQDNNRKQAAPINAGIVYRLSSQMDFTAGLERGNTVMLGLTLRGGLDRIAMSKLLDPDSPRVIASRPESDPDWGITAADLDRQTQWKTKEITLNGAEVRVSFDEAYGTYWNDRINRAIAVLHRDAPANVNRFVLIITERGTPLTERIVLRDSWVAQQARYQATAEHFESIASAEPRPRLPATRLWQSNQDRFDIGLAPHFQQTIGGPDGFILYQLGIAVPTEFRITDSTWISGRFNFRVVDNYEKFKYDAPSNLPRVRTFMREYLKSSRYTIPTLQISNLTQVSQNQFINLYAGYLEPMFAGVGGEWLYRPWHSPLAFGVDVNRVRQRDFKQDFGLQDYTVNTGHATLYWDTGWKSTHVKLSAGQYLAGDRGITMDISRIFDNGVALGAFATKTAISSDAFGEGSFDKGIYVSIPFESMMPIKSRTTGNFVWTPLTRDGGARLSHTSLYELTRARDSKLTRYAPAIPGAPGPDDTPDWITEKSIWDDVETTTTNFGKQLANGNYGQAMLWGTGITLASALLDKPVARWAERHQNPRMNAAGKAASAIPFVLAAGTGVLWWGAAGDLASETAWSSIKATAVTLGLETLSKYAVGRSRPEDNMGTAHFSGLGKKAANSSFPSIHMGTALALVTPFAQQYDAPWLYAVAGATSFGRIQQRQHFVSDVVAGSLIGYGIGTLLLNQQRDMRGKAEIAINPDLSIQARWKF